jgi:heat shock protein HslJ
MTARTALTAAVALLAMTTLSACGAGASSGLPTGRTFLSTAVTERGAPKQLVAGTRIQLSFIRDHGMFVATAGCNSISGPVSLRNGALVTDVNHTAMTLVGCLIPGLGEQDAWLWTFMTSSPALQLDGDQLTLTTTAVTVTFLDSRVAESDRPLVGTRWSVDTIFDGNELSSVQTDRPAELFIDGAGTFDATTGCAGGELHGTASVQASTITFTVTDQQPCTGASNALDAAVRSDVSGQDGYVISGGSLRLIQVWSPNQGLDHGAFGLGLHANDALS